MTVCEMRRRLEELEAMGYRDCIIKVMDTKGSCNVHSVGMEVDNDHDVYIYGQLFINLVCGQEDKR